MFWHIWQVQILKISSVFWGLICTSSIPAFSLEPPHEDSCPPSSHGYVMMSQLDQTSDSVRIIGWGPIHRYQATEKGRLSHRSTQPSQAPGVFCQFLCSWLGLALQLTSLRKEVASYILFIPYSWPNSPRVRIFVQPVWGSHQARGTLSSKWYSQNLYFFSWEQLKRKIV